MHQHQRCQNVNPAEANRTDADVTTDKQGLIANLLATDNEEFDLEITNKFILFTGKISVEAQQVYMHTSAAVSHMYHIQ